jgi:hypothetical protein
MAHDHYDANAPLPGMSEYGGSATGPATMGAMAAIPGYASTRSETRSDPSSRPQPPPRSPDRLLPGAAATRSVGTASHSHQASSGISISEQSDYSQGETPLRQTPSYQQQAPMSAAAAGYFNELPDDQRDIHQLPDNQVPAQSLHHRSVSGGSAAMSGYTGSYSQNGLGSEGYHPVQRSGQQSYELPGQNGGAPPAQQQSAGRYDRVPIRPGHISASHNF